MDVQNDFCPGGALAVAEGDAVVPVINRVAEWLAVNGHDIFASRDWHPPDARHFAANGGAWPRHCVQHTPGAAFHPDLRLPASARVVTKGDGPEADGYDAFEGHLDTGESFETALRARGVGRLVLAGLATDYCIKESALGGRRAGFDVTVLTDAVRAVDVAPGDGERALEELTRAGVRLVRSTELLDELANARSDGDER